MTNVAQARCSVVASKLRDLAEEVEDLGIALDDGPAAPPAEEEAPAAPVQDEVQYATTDKFPRGRTIEDFLVKDWTHAKMIAQGYIVEVVSDPEEAPTPPTEEAPTPPAEETPARVLTAKAQGASYEKLIDNGWTDETLVAKGLMEAPTATAESEKTWPFQDDDGNWIDAAGTVHDDTLHASSTTAGGPPPVTTKDVFKKSKKKVKTAATPAPPADDTPAPPPADDAPAPPPADDQGDPLTPAPPQDEALDPDLEAIVKGFNEED